MSDRITREEIMAKKSDYEAQESAFREQAKIDQNFIQAGTEWRKNLLAAYIAGFPPGFVHKSIPMAKIAVRSAKQTVMAGEIPDVRDSLRLEEGEPPSDVAESRRKTTEQFHKAFLYEVAMRTSSNPFSELLDKQYGLGPGILAFPWDDNLWPKEPDQGDRVDMDAYEEAKKAAWPWNVHVIHPLNIWPDPYCDPPQDYIIEDEISATTAQRRYPKLTLPKTGKVKRVAYCSDEWYAVYINNEAVFDGDGVVENPMESMWYELALSGLGERDENNDPVHLWQGLIRPLRDIISMIVTNYNIIEAIKFQEAFSPKQVKSPNKEAAQEAADNFEYAPLKLLVTESGVEFNNIFQGLTTQSSIWEQGELSRWIEILMGPLSGTFMGQERTASGLAQRVALQTAPFEPAKISAEQAIANMLRKVTRFYKTIIGKNFYLRHGGKLVRFKPEELLDDVMIEVELRPVTAADRAMTVDKDLKEMGATIISKEEYRRRQKIENGSQLDEESALEALKFHPAVVDISAQVIVQQIQQKFGMQPPGGAPGGEVAEEAFTPNPGVNGRGTLAGDLSRAPVPAGPGGMR